MDRIGRLNTLLAVPMYFYQTFSDSVYKEGRCFVPQGAINLPTLLQIQGSVNTMHEFPIPASALL